MTGTTTPGAASSVSEADEAALRAEIDKRKSEIERFEKGNHGPAVRNRCYVVNVDWSYQELLHLLPVSPVHGSEFSADDPAKAPGPLVSAPFIVDQNTRFYVKHIGFALLATGSLYTVDNASSIAANVVIPAILRAMDRYSGSSIYPFSCVTFRWKVRSTGNDRDWQTQFLPDWLLQSGSRTGLRFRRAQYCLVGGSEATVSVAPVFAQLAMPKLGSFDVSTGLSSISALRFQFAFSGVEVEG